MVNSKTPFDIFFSTLKYYLPSHNIIEPNEVEEKEIINDCFQYQKTYEIQLGNKVSICGMTRNGFFILKGKPYIWTWKETYCPNWIYKFKNYVEVWAAPVDKPWELYQGRFILQIHKDTLCYEGKYKSGLINFKEILDFYNLNIDYLLDHLLSDQELEKYKNIMNGSWLSKKEFQSSHPFLPNVPDKKDKEIFLCCMIKHLLCDSIPVIDSNDIQIKRIIHCQWLLGHIIKEYAEKKNDKILTYMMKRIYFHGQLLDNKNSVYELLSHTTRVIRGSPSFVSYEKRHIHPSHKGIYCPYRASEGENIGLAVDLTTDVQISSYNDECCRDDFSLQNFYETIKTSISTYKSQEFQLDCQSKNWSWADTGRVLYKEPNSIGYIAHEIIFRRHLPPVRTMYATTHIRQANSLAYSQTPIIKSSTSSTHMKNGCNALVAVCGFHGWNIEDAIIVNKSFIERGGLYSLHTDIITDKIIGKENFINICDNKKIIKENDVLYSKQNASTGKITKFKKGQGQIENIYLFNSNTSIFIKLHHLHKPEIGDKMSTRHGQKGVIGCMINQNDMPYDKNGVVPDIIINPAHLPSRLTTSQLLESFFGKDACIQGNQINDFIPDSDDKSKFNELNCGKSTLFCGITGKQLSKAVFFGPVYYFSLKHLVHKKCRFRNKGPIVPLTGQPTKGKQSNGGLRFGEMERDAIRTRNNDPIIQDRLMSDKTDATVCKNCGWLEPYKSCCENSHHINIKISTTTKLMLMEMYGLGIFPKLNLKKIT